ncbi:hypothetical protein CH340_06075 [Rhodoplanes serenus]|jgi:hypothetical protein|nr:hypothetical protein CH340_06075 [Rhodoplanes serenus]
MEQVLTGPRAKEAMDFRLIFAVAFAAFLVDATGRRVLMRLFRIGPPIDTNRSIVAEARALACKYVPFAFMG